MRLFAGVSVGEQFAGRLTTSLADWQSRLPLRWTRAESWHVTLQFLGEWPETRVSELIIALEAENWPAAFPLAPGQLSGFPDLDSPRVLFLQMKDDGSCGRLAGQVRRTVHGVWPRGPQDQRDFRAHLTLARVRQRLGKSDLNLLKKIELDSFSPLLVDRFSLIRSQLQSTGPEYSELASFCLRKKGE